MDRTSSALAAFRAGKLPSQQQTSRAVDALLNAPVLSNEPSKDAGQLSEEGVKLQNDLRQLLTAYKAFGESKNGESSCLLLSFPAVFLPRLTTGTTRLE